MIKNTEAYFKVVKEYQEKRAKLVSDFEQKLESLKRYEGSDGYQEDLRNLHKSHNEDMTAFQREYRQRFNVILKGMGDAIQKRKINPPTNDQLNLIHLLKMRKSVSEDDLDRVAQMVMDNGIAMGLLNEIAKDNKIMKNYESLCAEMSSSYAQKKLSALARNTEDFIKFDTPKAGRIANKYYSERYGAPERKLRKNPLYEDLSGCLSDMTGLDAEGLAQFSEIVDAV